MLDPRILRLQQCLTRHRPHREPAPYSVARASVALVVRPAQEGLELLLIKRATREGDPWSGHMALPGGRHEARDANDLETAVRETFEEVGIDLRSVGKLIGELERTKPLSGSLGIVISPFVFAVPPDTRSGVSPEVELSLWVPMWQLLLPETRTEYLYEVAIGDERRFPAFRFEGHTIWGMTHRILTRFLDLAAST